MVKIAFTEKTLINLSLISFILFSILCEKVWVVYGFSRKEPCFAVGKIYLFKDTVIFAIELCGPNCTDAVTGFLWKLLKQNKLKDAWCAET